MSAEASPWREGFPECAPAERFHKMWIGQSEDGRLWLLHFYSSSVEGEPAWYGSGYAADMRGLEMRLFETAENKAFIKRWMLVPKP